MFALGFILGAAFTWAMCWRLDRWQAAQDRWWQSSEGNRDARWPVLPAEATEEASDG